MSRPTSIRRLALVVPMVAAVALLGGCGGGESASSAPPPEAGKLPKLEDMSKLKPQKGMDRVGSEAGPR
jgi:hypothetical protein